MSKANPPPTRECETHVELTNSTCVKREKSTEIFWRERELLREKAELIVRGELKEPRDEWIGMRVGHTIHELYRRAPSDVKRAARQAFESVILAWFLGGTQPAVARSEGVSYVFNININNNVAEARAEARVEANILVDIDMDKLLGRLESVQQFLETIEMVLEGQVTAPRELLRKRNREAKTALLKSQTELTKLYTALLKAGLIKN